MQKVLFVLNDLPVFTNVSRWLTSKISYFAIVMLCNIELGETMRGLTNCNGKIYQKNNY